MSKASRWFYSLIIALAGAIVPGEAAEFSRAFSEYPANANPRTLISGKDGYLYGVIAEFSGGGRGTGGGIFRVAPDDDYRMLHRFDITRQSLEKNAGGATPTSLILMARDGCLYGLAARGGMFGQGVLYRLRQDGAFVVIAHLDSSQLPAGLTGGDFVNGCQGLVEGDDDAFYTLLGSSAGPNILRIGRDGSLSLVGQAEAYTNVLTDPASPRDLLCISAKQVQGSGSNTVFVDQVKITLFRVTGFGAGVVETITSPVFANEFKSLAPLAWTPDGLLVRAEWHQQTGFSHRLFRVNQNGSLAVLADFGWPNRPDLPPAMQFVHLTGDGTLYYGTDSASTFGSSLIERKPDGSFRTLCGFGDRGMIQAIPAGAEDLCGASFGSQVYLPAEGATGFSADWMTDETKHEILSHNRRGGLFFQVSLSDSPVVNSRPLAVLDVVKSKRSKSFIIRNLRNDWDPEGEAIHISNVVEPDHGYFDNTMAQSLYWTRDEGRSSNFARYEVMDRSSRLSAGTILILGNPSGTYLDPEFTLGRRPFMIDVKPNGSFTAGVPRANGGPVVMTGTLDWYNRGLAQVLLASGESIAFSVHLITGEDQPPALDYRIRRSDGSEVTGRATITH